MGTVSNLTFVSGGPGEDKTFFATYAPGAGEGFHTASAQDNTSGGIGLGQVDVDYGAKKVTVTHEWESGREYEIRVNFSQGVRKSGVAPARVTAGTDESREEQAVAAGANGAAPKPKSVRVAKRKVKAPKASKAPEPETKDS